MAIFSPNLTLIKITVVLKYVLRQHQNPIHVLKQKTQNSFLPALKQHGYVRVKVFIVRVGGTLTFLALVTETAHFFQFQ